jgi:carbon monoxide dehydrogenase subunit G
MLSIPSPYQRQRSLNIAGEITVAAPQDAVFKALSDAPFFASCIEGVRDLKAIDASHFRAVLETRIAYLRFNFKVDVEIARLSPPDEIEAKIEGTPLGIVGRLTATATTRLHEAGGQTVIHYSIDATLTGKLGSMGQPVLMAKAKDMEKHFTQQLLAAFAGGRPGIAS